MRNELDKARDEYLAVRGGYATFAKAQADRLSAPDAKDTYAWLDKAVPPRVSMPGGPGTPGERPEFDAGDVSLPEGAAEATVPGAEVPATSIDDLLKGIGGLPTDTGEGLETQPSPPVNVEGPAVPGATPSTEEAAPAPGTSPTSEGAAPATTDGSKSESSATPPVESNATPPASDAKSTEEKSAE
jgi:hypothetical protein